MALPGVVVAGWGSPGQAADILIEFTTSSANAQVPVSAEKVRIAGAVGEASADSAPLGHALDFSPPETRAVNLSDGTQPDGTTALKPLATTLQKTALPALTIAAGELAPAGQTEEPLASSAQITQLFGGEAESLVARAVGSAEGTRTPTGARTGAYYGHVDPGNYQWNQGTFSYQHGAQSPEEADQKQLIRLREQALELYRLAAKWGLTLNQEEALNGIDLANQAPLAALDRGYIDWLVTAKKMGLKGAEAIVWARTRSFIDPDTWRWNAPGLGNSIHTITADQSRRQQAIARAIAAIPQPVAATSTVPVELPKTHTADVNVPPAEAVDVILKIDLPTQLNP